MNQIGASELIINDRGAVYHLNLRPEELANTIITVGDPGRVAEVSKYFDKIERIYAEVITKAVDKNISPTSTSINLNHKSKRLDNINALSKNIFSFFCLHPITMLANPAIINKNPTPSITLKKLTSK